MKRDKTVLIEREVYSKEQRFNIPQIAEVVVLLDLVKIIAIKAREIE